MERTGNSLAVYRVEKEWDGPLYNIKRIPTFGIPTVVMADFDSYAAALTATRMFEHIEEQGYTAGYHDGYTNGRVTAPDVSEEANQYLPMLAYGIEVLGLTTRTYNCLRRSGIETVADLISHSEQDIEDIRNLGSKSLKETIAALTDYGFSLRRDLQPNNKQFDEF